jgi:hypothetical protein
LAHHEGLSFPPEAFLLAVAFRDNFERGFNPAEAALAYALAKSLLVSSKLKEIFPLLDQSDSTKNRAALGAASTLPTEALEEMAQGRLDLENALILTEFSTSERNLILAFFAKVHPSRQNRRMWLEWLIDLKRIEDIDLDQFLTSGSLADISGPQAEKLAREIIFSRRFPQVYGLQSLRKNLAAKLNLSPNIELRLDPELEDTEMALKLTFNSPSEIETLAAELKKLTLKEEWTRLWLSGEELK